MNFLKFDGASFVFELGKREKRLLIEVLKHYPLIPSSHHELTRQSDDADLKATQKLLEEALAERKQETKRQLQAMLDEKGRFNETKSGFVLSLSPTQADWLLEAINDIRVGSWLILGEPDEKTGKPIQVSDTNAYYLWTMELCGYFEAALLEAFGRRGSL